MSYIECVDCDYNRKLLLDIKLWFESIVEQLYSNQDLDLEDLENCLDEMSHLIKVKLPAHSLQIKRKSHHPITKTFNLEAWKQWNTEYLKSVNS